MITKRQVQNYTKKARKRIRERDGDHCYYCNVKLNFNDPEDLLYATVDHKLPQNKYPDLYNQDWNAVLSCKTCNTDKANGSWPNRNQWKDPQEILAWRRRMDSKLKWYSRDNLPSLIKHLDVRRERW